MKKTQIEVRANSSSPLYAPEIYKKLSACEKKAIVNGCGAGGWKIDLVPNTLYGLDVTSACNIHDYMYYAGMTNEDKNEADRVFLNNMIRLIDAGVRADSNSPLLMRRLKKTLRIFRRRRAYAYYFAVKKFGGPAFWQDKNNPKNLVLNEKE